MRVAHRPPRNDEVRCGYSVLVLLSAGPFGAGTVPQEGARNPLAQRSGHQGPPPKNDG